MTTTTLVREFPAFHAPHFPRPSRIEDRSGSFRVPSLARDIQVKIASTRDEFAGAFRLLTDTYRARGYETPGANPYRFTPFHVLPGTITIVAKDAGDVVATLSLVPDTKLLGLPMDAIYGPEVEQLRSQGRRIGEPASLAEQGLEPREFLCVFKSMIRLMMQYHLRQGGDSWAITVNPRHSNYYRKVLGFVTLGDRRSYPTVGNHPAEAFMADPDLIRRNAPRMHEAIFGENLPESVLAQSARDPGHVRYFAQRSTQGEPQSFLALQNRVQREGARPRWREESIPFPAAAVKDHGTWDATRHFLPAAASF